MLVTTIRLDSFGESKTFQAEHDNKYLANFIDHSTSIPVLNEPHLLQLAHDFLIDNQHVDPAIINTSVEEVLTGTPTPFDFNTDVLIWMPHPWDDIDLFITIITDCDKSNVLHLLGEDE